MSEEAANSGHSFRDAVAMVTDHMNPSEQPTPEAAPEAEAPEEAEEQEAPEDSEEPEDQTEGPEDSEQAEDDSESKDGEAEAEPELHTVKVDGEEKQVTLDELISGYQQTSAAQARFQQLAKERREFQSYRDERVQEYTSALQEAEGRRQAVFQVLAKKLKEYEPLKAQNPGAYYEAEKFYTDLAREVNETYASLSAADKQRQEKLVEDRRNETVQAVREQVPDWSSEHAQKVIKVAEDYGFAAEDLERASAHEILLGLEIAQLREKVSEYEQKFSQAKTAADKKVAKKPKYQAAGGQKPKQKGPSKRDQQKMVANVRQASQTGGRHAGQKAAVEALTALGRFQR